MTKTTVFSGVNGKKTKGTSYIRWGRKTCGGNATSLVYKGNVLYKCL